MSTYKTPGVYTEEISTLPPSVAPVETAVPAFVGYTERRPSNEVRAYRITSLLEYVSLFGGPFPEVFTGVAVSVDPASGAYEVQTLPADPGKPAFWLYYQLQMYFANGGGACYIVSIGLYADPDAGDMAAGLAALAREDEPTLIVLPDLCRITDAVDFYQPYKDALAQCAHLKDRFTLIDIKREADSVGVFRNQIGANHLSYGAAYYPWLATTLRYAYDETKIGVSGGNLPENSTLRNDDPQKSLFHVDNAAYTAIKNRIGSFRVTLPPSGAMAGVYAQVDGSRGVFKAPANVSLNNVVQPTVKISNDDQESLNVHPSGKSVNAIRSFINKGVMVWGARTLDGNSNEWRYISVRRLFIFLEESIGKAIERFLFEPNTQSTWVSVRGTIENFLTDQWQAGALAGTTAQQAFFVNVGLGVTMTPQDILEGRLIVDVGLAAVRPAEFIIIRFSHKLQEA